MIVILGIGIGTLLTGLALAGWAARTRQRKLRPSAVVMLDGAPHVLHALVADDGTAWGFEPLGEMLARTVVAAPPLTLYEVLAKAGWTPPPPDERPMVL